MQVKHLDHLNLSVRSFDETADWYAKVFGFEVVERGVQEGSPWGVLRSGEAMLCIYEHGELKHLDRFERHATGVHGINHFAFRITDGPKWLRTAEELGLELHYGGRVPYAHSSSWYVTDPTGYEIEVALWDDDTVRFNG